MNTSDKSNENKPSANQLSEPIDQDDDYNNCQSDEMTNSYSEISFFGLNNIQSIEQLKLTDSCNKAASSSQSSTTVEDTPPTATIQRPISLDTFPYNLYDGTVSVDGCITNYVAENLEYKIKLASPVAKTDLSLPNSRTSTPPLATTSSLHKSQTVHRQLLQQQQHSNHPQPHFDLNVLNDVEIEAQYLAASVDNLTENLGNLLHSISSITVDNVEAYKNSVNKLTDCMDGNIKSMYTIMAKTEEISNAMKPTEQLANRIREIKQLVDMLENTM